MTPTLDKRGDYNDLFLVSFLILFLELACIRWFGATVLFLTFFTNLVLLACFLGVSVGLTTATRRRDFMRAVLPLAVLAVGASVALASTRVASTFVVEVGPRDAPQEVFFGTEPRVIGDLEASRYVVPIEVLAGGFFVLIASAFVGLGQVMGRAFVAIPNRVAAYTVDVLGGLAGIAAFGVASWLRTPPVVWFAVVAAAALRFCRRLTWFQAACAVALVGLVGWWDYHESTTRITVWSPYYKVHYHEKSGRLSTNNIGHQAMVDVGATGAAYSLPYLLNRDALGRPFGTVLVIGAGSGNDVAAALDHGAASVDAVEIEPVLYETGRADHPRQPYSDPRVAVHIEDGRGFLRRTDRSYDLIDYALVDSLVLHSGYTSLRLESFLFTEQALRDVKSKLNDDGVFVMSNYYTQGWVVGRLVALAEKVFGAKPIVLGLPYRASIRATDGALGGNHTTILVGKPGSARLEAVRRQFAENHSFWVHGRPYWNRRTAAFGPRPPHVEGATRDGWQKIGPAVVDTVGTGPIPTDDWPFLYLKDRRIPLVTLRGMALVATLSVALLLVFAPVRAARPNGRMFFLGAGFMLLEAAGVVHLALLFGSTWIVNSVVFAAILVMALLGNLFVLAVKPKHLTLYYFGLIAALLVNAFVPMGVFLGLSGAGKVAATVTVVFVPIFFAGVIFASSFAASVRPDVDFASNVAGVVLGGLCENLSLVLGFDRVLLVAVAFYLLSAAFGSRSRVSEATWAAGRSSQNA